MLVAKLSFEDVVLKGLASDGGLFIPEEIPQLPSNWLHWRDLPFSDLAFNVISLYVPQDVVPAADLRNIVNRSYSGFRSSRTTPLVPLAADDQLYILELFHGPTLAFKDVALQFLGNLFEFFLKRRNTTAAAKRLHLTVVGATSGDTGSAAIHGLRGKKDISIFMLHPKGKVSPVQEAQMTTVLDENVHNLAVEGTFDDCQDMVKALFGDPKINEHYSLAAVNSINWARILAQITYYFSAYFQLLEMKNLTGDPPVEVKFVVPTGNFGDVLAGFFAKSMGLPVQQLVIATNENDILARFWKTGRYEKRPVHGKDAVGGITADGVQAHEAGVKETLSPAMDILVSSNFERLLWYLSQEVHGREESSEGRRKIASENVRKWLSSLKMEGGFAVDEAMLSAARQTFAAERVTDAETLETIRDVYLGRHAKAAYSKSHYVLDPHSAVGVAVARHLVKRQSVSDPPTLICLSTAHPAKFANAVEMALRDEEAFKFDEIMPQQVRELQGLPRKVTQVPTGAKLLDFRKIIMDSVQAESSSSMLPISG